MPDESVNCCVTSPPYWGLRNYGIPDQIWGGDSTHEHAWGEPIFVNATNHTDKRRWNHTRNGRGEEQPEEKQVAWLRTDVDQGSFCECGAWRGSLGLEPTPQLFVEHIVLVFQEVRRVLRPDGTCWLNLGDSYATGTGKATSPGGGAQGERFLQSGPAGYRGGHDDSPKHKNGAQPGFQPNRMPIPGLKPKDLVGVPWRCAFGLQEDGWWLRSDIIWAKPAPMPESVTDRPTRSHEYVFLLAKSQKYYYDCEAIKEPSVATHGSGNGYKRDSRLTYADENGARGSDEQWPPASWNGSRFDKGKTKAAVEQTGAKVGVRHAGKHSTSGPQAAGHRVLDNLTKARAAGAPHDTPFGLTRNKRDVWTINTQPTPDAHFATYPIALAETCILAGCPVDGLVLDPFAGAGTTGLAALKHGRNFLGIELNPEYIEIAQRRLDRHCPLFAIAP